MWNPKLDDSWEVKAFSEDTGNAMGPTWPPRSYTCTFCRREFRSAQALGGHMNVHRRDRARLHQPQPNFKNPNLSSTFLIPTQEELVANGGLCLLYSLPNPNTARNFMNYPAIMDPNYSFNSSLSHSTNITKVSTPTNLSLNNKRKNSDSGIDLELRLGCSSSGS